MSEPQANGTLDPAMNPEAFRTRALELLDVTANRPLMGADERQLLRALLTYVRQATTDERPAPFGAPRPGLHRQSFLPPVEITTSESWASSVSRSVALQIVRPLGAHVRTRGWASRRR